MNTLAAEKPLASEPGTESPLDGMRRIQELAAASPPVSIPTAARKVAPIAPAMTQAARPTAPAVPNIVEIDREAENIRSHLAEGEVVEGTLRLKSGISVAGTVTGEIHCETGTVVVEKTGVVNGGVRSSGNIIVDGQVGSPEKAEANDPEHPAIHTKAALIVLSSGRVYGRHEYGRIATYDDATLEGMGKKIKG